MPYVILIFKYSYCRRRGALGNISRTVLMGAKCPFNYETSENAANDIQKHLSIYILFYRLHHTQVSWNWRSQGQSRIAVERNFLG